MVFNGVSGPEECISTPDYDNVDGRLILRAGNERVGIEAFFYLLISLLHCT